MENMRLLDIFINLILNELTGALAEDWSCHKAAFSYGTKGTE